MIEDEVVARRRWLTREQFLDLLGATSLIPGPNSTELAIHVGHARAGWAGLLVAGVCFIGPAVAIVLLCAWAYVRFGRLPAATGILYGVKPVVIAVVVQALWSLGHTALRSPVLVVLGVGAVAAAVGGTHELVILFGAGVAMAAGRALVTRRSGGPGAAAAALGGVVHPVELGAPVTGVAAGATSATGTSVGAAASAGAATAVLAATPFGLWPLFGVFLKVGAVLFGSGYVLLAFLRADLVERLGWLSERQLLDAVAVGQITPGPVFTTATFIGYLLGRGPGAALATLGIFLPAFVFVALSGPLVPRLRRSLIAGAVLDGVNVASLALMAVVTWRLARSALVDPITVVIAVTSALLLIRFRVSSAWLVLGGAVVGVLVSGIRPA